MCRILIIKNDLWDTFKHMKITEKKFETTHLNQKVSLKII